MTHEWHIITPEYPPRVGGVGDSVFVLANALADAGDKVHIWCPEGAEPPTQLSGVVVHTELGTLSCSDLWATGRALNRYAGPRRILLQWVPHGFGWRSMNVAFTLWIWGRARLYKDDVRIMVHEAFMKFREGTWRQDAGALVQRLMTIVLMSAARETWFSIPRWEARWKPYRLGRRIPSSWLPLPSNVVLAPNAAETASIRRRYIRPGEQLVGHFGTFGTAVATMLAQIVPRVLAASANTHVVVIGPKGQEFREQLAREYPQFQARLHATGPISAQAPSLSWHLAACDLMIQPFPDGASTRRTSLLAQLAHGLPVVTTSGPSTEPLLSTSPAMAVVPTADVDGFVAEVLRLLADPDARHRLSIAAREFYDQRFGVERIVDALRTSYG